MNIVTPIPIREAQPLNPEDDPATREHFALHANLKQMVAEQRTKLDDNAVEIRAQRFENEQLRAEADRLRLELRELRAANNVYKVENATVATTAMAEMERVRDACVSAVRDVTEADRLLREITQARIKDVHEVAKAAIGRVFAGATDAIKTADEHALRAGLNPDEADDQPASTDILDAAADREAA